MRANNHIAAIGPNGVFDLGKLYDGLRLVGRIAQRYRSVNNWTIFSE